MTSPVVKKIERLREKIHRHSYLYYVVGEPKLSDLEFDRLMQQLADLERQHPELVPPESPTQRVGGEPIAGFQTVDHRMPMLSIDNTYSTDEVREFDRRLKRWLDDEPVQYVEKRPVYYLYL